MVEDCRSTEDWDVLSWIGEFWATDSFFVLVCISLPLVVRRSLSPDQD